MVYFRIYFQSWLVLNLPVFMFCLHYFNVPPTSITDLVRNVADKKIYWYPGTVTFVYVFAFINLVCVQTVIQLMNTPSISFLYYIKRLFHFFFKSDYCPRLWNRNFLCVICKQADILCYFLLNEKGVRVSRRFNSLFILYISTAKPFSLVRGYIEVKINKHEIW